MAALTCCFALSFVYKEILKQEKLFCSLFPGEEKEREKEHKILSSSRPPASQLSLEESKHLLCKFLVLSGFKKSYIVPGI